MIWTRLIGTCLPVETGSDRTICRVMIVKTAAAAGRGAEVEPRIATGSVTETEIEETETVIATARETVIGTGPGIAGTGIGIETVTVTEIAIGTAAAGEIGASRHVGTGGIGAAVEEGAEAARSRWFLFLWLNTPRTSKEINSKSAASRGI